MFPSVLLLALAVDPHGDWKCEFSHKQWKESASLEAPCRVFQGLDIAENAMRAKAAWGLSDSAADCAAKAWNGEDFAAKAIADCVEASPGDFALWVGLTQSFIGQRSGEAGSHIWDRTEAALSRMADPTPIAEKLMALQFFPVERAARVVIARHPERLAEVCSRPELRAWEGLQLVYPYLVGIAQPKRELKSAEWVALGRVALRGSLSADELLLAADIWKTLPAAARHDIAKEPLL